MNHFAPCSRFSLVALAVTSLIGAIASDAHAAKIAGGTAGAVSQEGGKTIVPINFNVDFAAVETPQCAAKLSVDGMPVETLTVTKTNRAFSRMLTLSGTGKKTIVLTGDAQGMAPACTGTAFVEVQVPAVTPKTPAVTAIAAPAAPNPASTSVPPATLLNVRLAANGLDKDNARLTFHFDGTAGRACGIDYQWINLQNGQTALTASARIDSPPMARLQFTHHPAFKDLGKWRLVVKPRAAGNTFNEPACNMPADKDAADVEFKAADGNHQADPLNLYHVKVTPGTIKIGADAANVKPVQAEIVVKRPSGELSSAMCAATVEVHRHLGSEYIRKAIAIESSKGLKANISVNEMMAAHGGLKAGSYRVRVYSSPFNASVIDPTTKQPARGCLGEAQDDLVVTSGSTIAGFDYSSVKYEGHSTIKLTPVVQGSAACRFKVRATVAHGNTDLSLKNIDYDFEYRPGKPQEEWVFRHHPPYYDNMKSRIVIESTPAQKTGGEDCLGRFEREVVFKPNIPKETVR